MHPTATRLVRALACAAVPVVLAAGCSSGSDDDKSASDDKQSPSPSASPTVTAARYAKLPEPCGTLAKKTVSGMVPGAKSAKGKTLPSADTNESGSCLWTGLDGYQYRSLTVSLKRFDSDQTLGAGDKRAATFASQQSRKAATAEGAKKVKTAAVSGVGEQASTVRSQSKKDGDTFRNQTVVARTANVVITVEYDGAGYEKAKTPDADKLLKDARSAAKDVVEAVSAANKGGSADPSTSSDKSKAAKS